MVVLLAGSNGDIATVQIEDRSMSPPQVQQTFSGIHGNCCMKVIDTTHVAVAGVANKEEGRTVHICFLKYQLTLLKVPITTAADDIHNYIFIVFQRK